MTHARRSPRAAAAGVVAAIVALSAVLATADAPSATASTGACGDGNGVTVVVDFAAFGGGVNVRCAPSGGTGYAALDGAGFTHQSTSVNPGFLCRINDLPSSTCGSYPPGNAYWSYWIAARGGHWCYSTEGAATRRPPAGTVEGWAFSLPNTTSPTPGIAPPVPADGVTPVSPGQGCSAPTTTTTTAPPPPAPSPTASPSEQAAAPVGGATTTTARGQTPQSTPGDSPAATTASSNESPTTAASSSSGGGGSSGGDAAAGTPNITITDESGSGSPAGLMVSGGLIALLAGGGYLWARRRRLPDEDLSP